MNADDETSTAAVGQFSNKATGTVPSLSTTLTSLSFTQTTCSIDSALNNATKSTAAAATASGDQKIVEDKRNEEKDKEQSDVVLATTTSRFIPDTTSIPISLLRCFRIEKYDMDINITVQLFQERTVVTCCQASDGKITSWLLCQPILNMYSLRRQLQWEVSHVLGGRKHDDNDTLLTVYCQRIATRLWERLNAAEVGDLQLQLQPKTILFGFTLCRKMPPSGGILPNNDERSNANTNAAIKSTGINVPVVGIHTPELFHGVVDLVVQTIVEAISAVAAV